MRSMALQSHAQPLSHRQDPRPLEVRDALQAGSRVSARQELARNHSRTGHLRIVCRVTARPQHISKARKSK
ncbi:uncharacterized protein B0H18DRAFT_1004777 [Fomitopsis serialis]|uniref:uncharacterized protein n=1 Tax=Fomitopsis serialis TaxID=139415 RepID=UPI00200830F8|nr:uncharacterized protein B0H18DRAFT_1004777 [Neoantrodia serialis]KAH9926974.1 hypothetical protein B0H18DRAFT_1004777 [Neoantrodia serialis]